VVKVAEFDWVWYRVNALCLRSPRCSIYAKPILREVTAMHQIADWLKNLGMSEYEQRFVDNRIDSQFSAI